MQTQVVQEKEWLGSLYDQVIDIHGNTVDAKRVIGLKFCRQLDFRTNPVSACCKDRVTVVALEQLLIEVEPKEACKSTHGSHDTWAMGAFQCGLHHGDSSISGVNIYARFRIGESGGGWLLRCHRVSVSLPRPREGPLRPPLLLSLRFLPQVCGDSLAQGPNPRDPEICGEMDRGPDAMGMRTLVSALKGSEKEQNPCHG